MDSNNQTIAVDAHEPASHGEFTIISPDVNLAILTYVTFFVLLGILYKYAWKPILNALDERENTIRRAFADADKAREELARINETEKKIINEADLKAREIVERARKGAVEAAKHIEKKAKEEVQIMLGNANHEIAAQKEKAQMQLRKESAYLAVALTNKILDEELSESKHKHLLDKLIKEFRPEDYENA